MNVVMMTNIYRPHVGGLTRSIDAFSDQFREAGHAVTVVAPEFDGQEETGTEDIVRLPSFPNIFEGKYSLPLSPPGYVADHLIRDGRDPDMIHAHHPFLAGSLAVRVAHHFNVPLVYTHHTRYEVYVEDHLNDSDAARAFVEQVSANFCNLCDAVVAPSSFIADQLREEGVERPIRVIPTGVDLDRFASPDRLAGRERLGLPADAVVAGYIGRISPEKNLDLLFDAAAKWLADRPDARFVFVGDGASRGELERRAEAGGLSQRITFPGLVGGDDLVNAFAALDCFAFSSLSETQGMVITEAMAVGTPVAAIHASGVDDVVRDGENGFHAEEESAEALAAAIEKTLAARESLSENALKTARNFSIKQTARDMLELYRECIESMEQPKRDMGVMEELGRRMQDEIKMLGNLTSAAYTALQKLST